MTNITETNTFSANVNEYDTTDPVLGGPTGESNDPIISLANRTRYLKNYINGYDGIKLLTGSGAIDATHAGKLTYINTSVNMTATIAATSNFILGQKISIKTRTTGIRSIKIVCDGSDSIVGVPAPFTSVSLWLHDNEYIELVYTAAGEWQLIDVDSNLNQCGNDAMVRRLPKNSAVAIGTTGILRVDVARLWFLVNAMGLAVADSQWLIDNFTYRQCYSTGNNTTTMRIPDMRSMVWKGLDAGRGLSLTRTGTIAGSYEADRVGPHTHPGVPRKINDVDRGTGNSSLFSIDQEDNTGINNANSETTVKTAGLIAVIYY